MSNSRNTLAAKRKSEKGFTLIEVLAAMIIAALGILSLAPMMVVSIQGNGESDSMTQATMQAQTTLETLKQQDPLPPIPYTNVVIDSITGLTQHVAIDNSTADGAVPSGLYRLSVTVTWTDKAGVDRSVQYSTLRAR